MCRGAVQHKQANDLRPPPHLPRGRRLHAFFFFKQETAYEIETYWSSDVCSSDLLSKRMSAARPTTTPVKSAGVVVGRVADIRFDNESYEAIVTINVDYSYQFPRDTTAKILRSEERRVGQATRVGATA